MSYFIVRFIQMGHYLAPMDSYASKPRLFCPGPTPVPDTVALAMQNLNVYHRTDDFCRDFIECRRLLAPFFGTSTHPLIITASGSGAMEAAVTNLTDLGDSVLVIVGGKFGERWQKLCETYGCKTEVHSIDWGTAPDPQDVAKRAVGKQAVFLQANETSTGAFFPIKDIAATLRSSGFQGLIVVDAISALAAHEIRMDDWRLDCVVSGSQKGFGIPPGLAFVALSQRALGQLTQRPRFYFDLRLELKGQDKGQTAFTPATSLILGLKAALGQLHAAGLPAVLSHHDQLARAARASCLALGLTLFAARCPSNALTAMRLPEGIDGEALLKAISRQDAAVLAGGQDHLKGKIVRLAHLGFVDRLDLIAGIGALEFGLSAIGHQFTLGSGVAAAMNVLNG